MNVTANGRPAAAGWLICFGLLLWVLMTGFANGAPPTITVNYPADLDSTGNPYMDMSLTVSADNYPVILSVYGDSTSNPSDLIFANDAISAETTVSFRWNSLRLSPDVNTVGLWHFDENTGSIAGDASGSGNSGTFMNGPLWTANGRFGYGIDFDGTDDYITVPDLDNSLDADPTTGVITMEAWLYPHQIGSNTYRAFLSKRDAPITTAVNYSLYLNNTNGAISFYNGTFPAGFYISNVIPPVNQWSYIVVSLDAAEGMLRFYRNGEIQDSISGVSFGPVNDAELTIGTSRTPSGDRCFDGVMDDVRITTRLLTADEVEQNYRLNRDIFAWKAEAIDALSETTVSSVFNFTVALALDPMTDQSVAEGDNISIPVMASNPDNEPIGLSSSTPPANAGFSDNGGGTGTFDFSPDFDQAGEYPVTFYADDGIQNVYRTITITVTNTNRPPVVSDIPDQETDEGSTFAALDLSGYVNDPDVAIDDAITWTYSGNTELSVDIAGNIATIGIPDADWYGAETITFRATDLEGAYDENDAVFTVSNVNDSPVMDEIIEQNVMICNDLSFAVASSDIDGIVEEIVATLSPSGNLPEGASFTDLGDGTGTFDWTPDPSQFGTYSLRFTAVDDSGATGYGDVTVNVQNDVTAPQIALTSPANGLTSPDPYMTLSAGLTDETPMTIWVYGGYDASAMNLLAVEENITASSFNYDWNHPVLRPDPINTVGLWHFDENNGSTVQDAGSFGNDGQIIGQLPFWTGDGQFGYAVDLNGDNNYIVVPYDPSLDVDSAAGMITIEAWIYPRNDGNDNRWRGLVAKRAMLGGDGPCNYQMSLNPQNYLSFYSSGIDWSQEHISSLLVPYNQWSYLVITLDAAEGGRLRFYRNGILEDTIDGVTFGPADNSELTIGTASRQIECFNGLMDEVRVTKRVMGEAEIAANYSHIGGGVHYWKMAAENCAGLLTMSSVRSFTVVDDTPPQVTILSPANGAVAIYPHMELSFKAEDESPLMVFIYGDATPSAADLLYVCDNAKSTLVDYDWTAAPLEPDPPFTAGLWNFDGSQGDSIIDISYNGNNGHFMNGPARTAGGRFGYAIDFDGVNDYITVPYDNSLDIDPATGVLTMEAWLYPHQIGGGVYRAFLSKRNPGVATEVNYSLYLDQTDGAISFYNGVFPAGFYISDVIPPINEWSYIAVTLSAAEGVLRFYLNGVLVDSIEGASFGEITESELTIGVSRTPSGSRYYDGLIDDVRLTRRILSSNEIAANYSLSGSTYYWRVCAFDITNNSCSSEIRYFTTNLFICGDANSDGSVNVADAVFLVNFIFKEGDAPDPIEAGDANGDGQTNVGDAVYLINYVFKGGPPPVCP